MNISYKFNKRKRQKSYWLKIERKTKDVVVNHNGTSGLGKVENNAKQQTWGNVLRMYFLSNSKKN